VIQKIMGARVKHLIYLKKEGELLLMKMGHNIKKRDSQSGFTLVELMVAVVIIGILVAIAVPVYSTVTTTVEQKACLANMKAIEAAIETYRVKHGKVPENLSDLWGDSEKILKEEPICPSGDKSYEYTPGTDGNYTLNCPNHNS
jgi:prepilin-type N-terminal cleavage/methylation domain-containing protein